MRMFPRAAKGSAAVEFAIVSIPFFLLLFAIIEISLLFFITEILDTAVAKSARLIRTGIAKQTSMTANSFKTDVCNHMFSPTDCNSNLILDVRSYMDFASTTSVTIIDADGNIQPTQYTNGNASEIIVVRAYYPWPVFFGQLSGGRYLADGRRVLAGAAAFKNEPFPW
jgi:Flp pilus assembly protein TadG